MTPAVPLAFAAAVAAAWALVEWVCARADAAARHTDHPRDLPSVTGLARLVRLLAALGRRAGLPLATPGDLDRRRAAAGLPEAVGSADIMAVKAGAGLAGGLIGLGFVLGAAPGRLGPVLAVAVAAAGFLVPDAWLRRRTRRRSALLAADLPDVLDLLRVAVASGLPVTRALQAVGRLRGGLLAHELGVCAQLVELGLPRSQALGRLAARCPLPGVLALVAAVQRAERHGTPLATALAALAADARADRARRIQDRAARAAPKIQLAVALLLVPAAMLLMAAGLVAGMT